MLQHKNKTKENVYSETLGHSSPNINWNLIKVKAIFTWTNKKGHQTPGPSLLTKSYRLINKFMNYKLNKFFVCEFSCSQLTFPRFDLILTSLRKVITYFRAGNVFYSIYSTYYFLRMFKNQLKNQLWP